MTDGNTHAIAQHLDEREDWDALQEVTTELEQAEARIAELEAELEGRKTLMLALAGDKINLVSELAGVKDALQEAKEELQQAELDNTLLIVRIEELEVELEIALEALEKLARLGNGDHYGNSEGNMIARNAIAVLKGETDDD